MSWFKRLQERLSITQSEGFVVLGACLLFVLGLGVRYLQEKPKTVPPLSYADSDSLFQKGINILKAGRDSSSTAEPDQPAQDSAEPADLRIDLNVATAADLELLPRIGPVMAARIVAYRDAHGPFEQVQDITLVDGIGEKTLDDIAPFLFVTSQ